MSNARALAAARRLQFSRGTPVPLDYVEAIKLESMPQRRQAAILHAATMLAEYADCIAATEEIGRTFFAEPPRQDAQPDETDPSVADLRAPAEAPAPGQSLPGEDPEGFGRPLPAPRDGERTIEECETACEVLCEAVLQSYELRDTVAKLALSARLLSTRASSDKTGAIRLRKIADKLRDASKAAGTHAPSAMGRSPETSMIDVAMQRGAGCAEVAAMTRFGREYDALIATGHRPSATRRRYVELSMERWHREQENR